MGDLCCLPVCSSLGVCCPRLLTLPLPGLRVEAAIDYYESLRMARLLNHTSSDPASLNIDLDFFMGKLRL